MQAAGDTPGHVPSGESRRGRVLHAVRGFLPEGIPLQEEIWVGRHRALLTVLWLHAIALPIYGLVQGLGPLHSLFEGSLVALAGIVGAQASVSKPVRMAAVTLGLVTSSAVMVHISGGLIEAHFHFFVMVAVITLYQAWIPFLLAIGYVVLHHGITGALDPSAVFNHAAALRHPWRWAAVHGAFIAGASAAGLSAWRLNEQAYRKLASSFESQLVREQHHLQEQARAQHAVLQSEEKFRALVQNSYDIVTLIGPSMTVEYVSPSVERVLGYKPEDLLGTTGAEITHEEDRAVAAERFAEILENADATSSMTIRARHANGTWRWLEITLHNLTSNPAINGIVAHQRDVTDRKLAEDSSRWLEEQLRQSQKMEAVGQLAGGIAHDFNNLLSVIQNFARFVYDEMESGDPRRDDIQEVLGAGDRAANLVRQLLTFSRKEMIQAEVCDLNRVVEDIVKLLRRTIPEHVELQMNLADGALPVTVDTGQMEQVIMNITVNARDAMADGGRLTVTSGTITVGDDEHWILDPGTYAHLSLADTGVGMDEATRARVFEPFFTTKSRDSGTGLGLATVYGIVEHAGGHVLVDSEVGRGTRFDIFLPLAESDAKTKRPQKASASPAGAEVILVVEDEGAVRSVVERILRNNGYQVLTAASGPDAVKLALATRAEIDLLLTDMVMPHMSGPDLAAQLPGLPTLYMSGYSEEITTRHGVLDQEHFIQKPFTADTLLAKVRLALDASKGTSIPV